MEILNAYPISSDELEEGGYNGITRAIRLCFHFVFAVQT